MGITKDFYSGEQSSLWDLKLRRCSSRPEPSRLFGPVSNVHSSTTATSAPAAAAASSSKPATSNYHRTFNTKSNHRNGGKSNLNDVQSKYRQGQIFMENLQTTKHRLADANLSLD